MSDFLNKNSLPFVSVLMPVYNSELYLKEAIDSILYQTYTYFEFIIINDGSIDKSEEIIKSYDDSRIIFVANKRNLGIIETLNKGLEFARGKYIIRMDADDYSYPNRFEKQVEYMESNQDIDISGTWFMKTDRSKVSTNPITFEKCKLNLLDTTVLCHPTVILRKKSILQEYLKFNSSAIHAEDYKFWMDAVTAGLKISNLPIVLLRYRIHPMQISTTKRSIQNQTVNNLRIEYAEFFFGELITKNKDIYSQLIAETISDYKLYKEAKKIAFLILKENYKNNQMDKEGLKILLRKHIRVIASRVFSKNKYNFQFVLKAIIDGNFYSKTNVKSYLKV